ncbi:MAG: FAD:protein FMN transferase [Chloroflexota bacterium]
MDITMAELNALGTSARVVVLDAQCLPDALHAVRQQLRAIDAACSRFRPDSELNRVNEAGGQAVAIGPLLTQALEVALRASRLTDGIVDATIGDALLRLGYSSDFASLAHHGAALPLTLYASPGWQMIDLDAAAGMVRIPPGTRLDLGATAKAFAADLAAARAYEVAGRGVLVSLGGDIAVAGEAPPGGWTIRITDDCHAALDAPGQTIAIRSGGVATSSTTVRRWMRGGATLHHILDPATGLPARERWRTVSVAAGSCTDANIASTAAIVLGDRAPAWLSERSLPARLVGVDELVLPVAGWPVECDVPNAGELPV